MENEIRRHNLWTQQGKTRTRPSCFMTSHVATFVLGRPRRQNATESPRSPFPPEHSIPPPVSQFELQSHYVGRPGSPETNGLVRVASPDNADVRQEQQGQSVDKAGEVQEGQDATFVLGRPRRRQNATETPGSAFPLAAALPGALSGNLQGNHKATGARKTDDTHSSS